MSDTVKDTKNKRKSSVRGLRAGRGARIKERLVSMDKLLASFRNKENRERVASILDLHAAGGKDIAKALRDNPELPIRFWNGWVIKRIDSMNISLVREIPGKREQRLAFSGVGDLPPLSFPLNRMITAQIAKPKDGTDIERMEAIKTQYETQLAKLIGYITIPF